MTIKIREIKVRNVVMVVEALANFGTFKMALLSRVKAIRVTTAKVIESINFQLNNSKKMFLDLYKFPPINCLSPNKTIEKTLEIQ